MRIAVIGLGVLGASVAGFLAERGADVTVFERTHPGAGTTGTSFAWTNSHQKEPLSYHELNLAGMAAHESLRKDASRSNCDWYFPSGVLEWAGDDAGRDRLAGSVARLTERGYSCEWIDPRRAVEYVPDLIVPAHVRDLVWYPREGYVLPIRLLARLWGRARDHGAVARFPVRVTAVAEVSDGVRLSFSEGEPELFDRVVFAAGRWTEELAASAGLRVPMAASDDPATAGYLAYTGPNLARIGGPVLSPGLNVRPDGGGRLIVQALDIDAEAGRDANPSPAGSAARRMTDRLRGLLHGTENSVVERIVIGRRSYPADGLTIAGHLGAGRCYVLATHSGITLGPLLGQLAAGEVLSGQPDDLLKDFRPDRFAGRSEFPR